MVASVTSQTALRILQGARSGSGVVGEQGSQAPAPKLTTVVGGDGVQPMTANLTPKTGQVRR